MPSHDATDRMQMVKVKRLEGWGPPVPRRAPHRLVWSGACHSKHGILMKTTGSIRVAIADASPIVCTTIAHALASSDDITVSEAATTVEA